MKRKWFLAITIFTLVLVLAGCGKSVEEQIDTGVASAQTVFEENPQKPNQTLDKIELFVPSGYTVEQSEDKNNLLLKKGNENYILFVNINEDEDSNLHYEILKNNKSKQIVKEQTVKLDGAFGFTAVVEHGEGQFELVVSSGGVKMTTISEDKNIDVKLVDMMQIVRSVNILD
ncbi:hypothetical protein ACIQ34_15765 [Ureibacillus sp. NPDC094379]